MGLLDVILGRRKLPAPAPDRLFAISTAYVTFETQLQISSRGAAGIVFHPLQTADFLSIVRDTEEVVKATASDAATTVESSNDPYGYRWLILRGKDFDQLVVGINAVSSSLESGGYGDRLLCAVFSFEDEAKRSIYWIYNYKRGSFYPFVPEAGTATPGAPTGSAQDTTHISGDAPTASNQRRNNERELVLKAQVGSELPVEPELERWFPLWGIPI
ncbi:MAG: PspA-associated protein PspAB [Solirubrobacteraceae bacterium]